MKKLLITLLLLIPINVHAYSTSVVSSVLMDQIQDELYMLKIHITFSQSHPFLK